MIKAEDLRIGDLVRVNCDCEFPKETVCTVSEIRESKAFKGIMDIASLISVNGNGTNPSGVWCSDIEGIPLTPEILEKNGWERDKLVPYIYGHEAHYIEVICTPNSEWMYVTFKGETIHRIKYVHELQHILWALGKDVNLKI